VNRVFVSSSVKAVSNAEMFRAEDESTTGAPNLLTSHLVRLGIPLSYQTSAIDRPLPGCELCSQTKISKESWMSCRLEWLESDAVRSHVGSAPYLALAIESLYRSTGFRIPIIETAIRRLRWLAVPGRVYDPRASSFLPVACQNQLRYHTRMTSALRSRFPFRPPEMTVDHLVVGS
jgi:hypothetical protein